MGLSTHQYIERGTGRVCTERLFADRLVNFLYSEVRENLPAVFRALTSARGSSLLGFLNFDTMLGARNKNARQLISSWGVDVDECLDDLASLDTAIKVFTRKIRYWDCRAMPEDASSLVSPADSRVLLGSFGSDSLLFIKEKFFSFAELLCSSKSRWLKAFEGGDFAIFRLTPEKYHWVHTPVAGRVVDFYEIPGHYHSCNPAAVVNLVSPYSKNKRVVTVIDTDVPGGTGAGLVAMIEVVALMVGEIQQCYSKHHYNDPQPVTSGMFLGKGAPKSLFKPGSSTVVVITQAGRVGFDGDLVRNQHNCKAMSRFSHGFGRALVETDIQVRDRLGSALQ